MVRDRRLASLGWTLKVAATYFALGRGDREQSQPDRIQERREHGRKSKSVLGGDRCIDECDAARIGAQGWSNILQRENAQTTSPDTRV